MQDLARLRYEQHKQSASQRGIEFDLTFDEWKSIWGLHIANRGRNKGQLVMARQKDEGGYSKGNVRIATHSENVREAVVLKTKRLITQEGIDQGWLKRTNVFNEYREDDE